MCASQFFVALNPIFFAGKFWPQKAHKYWPIAPHVRAFFGSGPLSCLTAFKEQGFSVFWGASGLN